MLQQALVALEEDAMEEEKLPGIFKDHEIKVGETNPGDGDWEAHVKLVLGYEWILVPGGPFPTVRAAHKNAINFLVRSK